MRILYLTPDLFGPPSGIARYCRMVCRSLVESGHKITIVSLLDQQEAQSEAKATFPTMQYVPCNGNRKRFVLQIVSALRMRPEVILVGHPNFAPLGWVLGLISRAKVINFIYGIDAWEPLSSARRRTLGAGNKIISISRFTAMRSKQVNGIPIEKVSILPNCLDPNFAERPSIPSSEDALSLLTVSRINLSEGYKGHNVVIRALPRLLKSFPNLIYDVVGDGDGRTVLEALAKEENVSHAVRFHGVVSEEKLIEHYQKASLFVMPSRFEGFGFVFLEAMTYGKPVVCGNEDASVEVVKNGETGFTVDPQSSTAVADAVEKLLSDKELRERMGKRGVEIVASDFGFDKFRDTLLEYLK